MTMYPTNYRPQQQFDLASLLGVPGGSAGTTYQEDNDINDLYKYQPLTADKNGRYGITPEIEESAKRRAISAMGAGLLRSAFAGTWEEKGLAIAEGIIGSRAEEEKYLNESSDRSLKNRLFQMEEEKFDNSMDEAKFNFLKSKEEYELTKESSNAVKTIWKKWASVTIPLVQGRKRQEGEDLDLFQAKKYNALGKIHAIGAALIKGTGDTEALISGIQSLTQEYPEINVGSMIFLENQKAEQKEAEAKASQKSHEKRLSEFKSLNGKDAPYIVDKDGLIRSPDSAEKADINYRASAAPAPGNNTKPGGLRVPSVAQSLALGKQAESDVNSNYRSIVEYHSAIPNEWKDSPEQLYELASNGIITMDQLRQLTDVLGEAKAKSAQDFSRKLNPIGDKDEAKLIISGRSASLRFGVVKDGRFTMDPTAEGSYETIVRGVVGNRTKRSLLDPGEAEKAKKKVLNSYTSMTDSGAPIDEIVSVLLDPETAGMEGWDQGAWSAVVLEVLKEKGVHFNEVDF